MRGREKNLRRVRQRTNFDASMHESNDRSERCLIVAKISCGFDLGSRFEGRRGLKL